jgi:hypothetical protein
MSALQPLDREELGAARPSTFVLCYFKSQLENMACRAPRLPIAGGSPCQPVGTFPNHEGTMMSRDENGHIRLAGRPADYQKLGIDPIDVARFEDGQRMGTAAGQYEWWYFDAHLDDGTTLVVAFYTKSSVNPSGPLAPRLSISLTLADGRRYLRFLDTPANQFAASREMCDVRMGANRFAGDLRRYRIVAAAGEISVDAELIGEVRPWRPRSGHLYFGPEGRERLFAWLPSVPQGVAKVRYRIGHLEYRASGSGYHDHNWGDVPMHTLMHNWYWARGKAGPYAVIASCIMAAEAYGCETQIVYMLSKDHEIIADDDAKVAFRAERVSTDVKTGKPVADVTRYIYRDADARYVVSFERQSTILQAVFASGAYHRFTGKVTVEKFDKDVGVEMFDGCAIWELMYFGRARPTI